jgi:[acyl-carrier-protein] S-malonyltransferase
MQGASLKLTKELERVKINPPKIPLVANVTARTVNSAEEIKAGLIKQVYSSVLWEDSMKFILSKGVMNFIEFGPGKVLKGLLRRINEKAQVVNIGKKEDICA